METITISEINRYNKTSKSTGKPFVSVAIKTSDGRSISGFGNKDNQEWKAGDEVSVDIEQKGEYLNFSMPKGTFQKGGTAPDALRLEAKIDAILAGQKTIGGILTDMRGVISELLQSKAHDDGAPF